MGAGRGVGDTAGRTVATSAARAHRDGGAGTNVTAAAYMRYIEADIAGVASFPEGVQLVLGSFPALFGTVEGAQLQAWCTAHSWPLAWAKAEGTLAGSLAENKGGGEGGEGGSFEGKDRLLDPSALVKTRLNRTFTSAQTQRFAAVWQQAATLRSSALPHTKLAASDNTQLWDRLVAALDPALVVQPPLVGTCAADMTEGTGCDCIGVDASLDCVCACPPSLGAGNQATKRDPLR